MCAGPQPGRMPDGPAEMRQSSAVGRQPGLLLTDLRDKIVPAAGCDASDRLESKVKRRRGHAGTPHSLPGWPHRQP
jgi:hypothetical protein